MTAEERDEMIERFRAYVASPEGKQEIQASLAAAQKTIDELRKSRRVPWWRLHEPMTI